MKASAIKNLVSGSAHNFRGSILSSLVIGFFIVVQAPTFAQKPAQQDAPKVEAKSEIKIEWAKLSAEQHLALAPVQREWATMSGAQQKRLVSAAKDYAKLQPIQKERFQTRLRDWATLTPEQRKTARTKYETLSKLPPAKQFEIHEKWQDKQASKTTPNAPTPSESGSIGGKAAPAATPSTSVPSANPGGAANASTAKQ